MKALWTYLMSYNDLGERLAVAFLMSIGYVAVFMLLVLPIFIAADCAWGRTHRITGAECSRSCESAGLRVKHYGRWENPPYQCVCVDKRCPRWGGGR